MTRVIALLGIAFLIGLSAGLINPDSGAIHLVVSKDEMIVGPERNGIRRIYLDGRKHPDLSRWTPTGSGHSVGRFENDELVVDTIGMVPGGVVAGGYRTPETHLTERFILSANGSQRLSI
jgi:hypothetical protein